MIDPKLMEACTAVDEWCGNNHIKYDLVCDETDLQGFMLFKKNRKALAGLLEHLKPHVDHGVHLDLRKVRGGNILAFSLKAISENQINRILAEAGEEEMAMTFKDRISDAFIQQPLLVAETEDSPSFLDSAKKIAESQRKSATGGMNRSNQSSFQREQHASNTSYGGVEHGASARAQEKKPKKKSSSSDAQATKGASKGGDLRFENKVRSALEMPISNGTSNFDTSLNETLQGIATATGMQPGELFNQFARALQVLGQQLGIGPLQDQLKKQGIQWKKSDDGLAIILYIQNASTGAPQPIARITAETLENPRDFEDQLTNMLDFAKGEAPGSLRQKQQEMKDQEGAIRDIAQAISPESEESAVAKQMNQSQTACAPAPEAVAATQAASPKIPQLEWHINDARHVRNILTEMGLNPNEFDVEYLVQEGITESIAQAATKAGEGLLHAVGGVGQGVGDVGVGTGKVALGAGELSHGVGQGGGDVARGTGTLAKGVGKGGGEASEGIGAAIGELGQSAKQALQALGRIFYNPTKANIKDQQLVDASFREKDIQDIMHTLNMSNMKKQQEEMDEEEMDGEKMDGETPQLMAAGKIRRRSNLI